MMRTKLKSKISYATVTQTELYYQGSITIAEDIMIAADLMEGEKVEVLNLHNGVRLETYVIRGEKGSGCICLNGPAARLGYTGDKVFILSYGLYAEEEAARAKARFVELGEGNAITDTQVA
ncbi:MAG: aspartate 1-decarboxylase [Candidatus Omnitrophica bacterium]|nr:aspartate 1-decarboxylase [Candidatus Omnitrophota bacterium]